MGKLVSSQLTELHRSPGAKYHSLFFASSLLHI